MGEGVSAGENSRCSLQESEIVRAVLGMIAASDYALSSERINLPPIPDIDANGRVVYSQVLPNSPFWNSGWEGRPPGPQLVEAWHKASNRSGGSCVTQAGANHASASGAVSYKNEALGGASRTVRVSRPALDADKKEALILYNRVGGGLENTVEILHLAKVHGAWTKVGSRILSVG